MKTKKQLADNVIQALNNLNDEITAAESAGLEVSISSGHIGDNWRSTAKVKIFTRSETIFGENSTKDSGEIISKKRK